MQRWGVVRAVVVAAMVAAVLTLGPADPAGAMPADSCASSGSKTISGTAQGEDGRYLWAFIGIEFFDAAGNKLPGASASGYHCHIRVNENLVDGNGSPTSQGVLTKNWSVAAPAGTGQVWLEMYVKTNQPPGGDSRERYGWAKREKTPVGPTGRVINLKAPLRCGITGDNGVEGRTSKITGRIYADGRPVGPTSGAWIAAWSQVPDTDSKILGWSIGTWKADGSFEVPHLAADLAYSLWVFPPGKAPVTVWNVPVGSCSNTARNIALSGTAPPPAPPPPEPRVPSVQLVSGDFDGDGADDVLTYRPGSSSDHVAYGGQRGDAIATRSHPINGSYRTRGGDFDADGNGDVLFHAPTGDGDDFIWYGRDDRGFDSVPLTINRAYHPVTGDFDADDTTDILWYAPGTQKDHLWTGSPGRGGFTSTPLVINGTYQPLVGDYGGDGRVDILWYAPGPKMDYVWTSTGAAGNFTSKRFPVNGTYAPIVGDFDGDTDDDILWYAKGSRQDHVWISDGTGFRSERRTINGDYVTDAGDYDGDDADDIVWRSQDRSRNDYFWYGAGSMSFTSRTIRL